MRRAPLFFGPNWAAVVAQLFDYNLNVHVAWRALSCSISPIRVWFFHMEPFMAWNTPELVEICIGMEINAYAPAEL